MEKKQASKLEMHDRENAIMDMIQEGRSFSDICETIAAKFEISPRTVERNYYAVVDALGSISNERKRDLRAILIARQDGIYKKAMSEGNYDLALKVTAQMAKTGGLFDTIKESEPSLPTVIELVPKAVGYEPEEN